MRFDGAVKWVDQMENLKLNCWGDVFGGAVISCSCFYLYGFGHLYGKSPTLGCGPGSDESPRLCTMSPSHSDVPLPHHPSLSLSLSYIYDIYLMILML